MVMKTFQGGVHPKDRKNLVKKDGPIVELLPKSDLVYNLSQHIGAPATPIVEVGERVLRGQLIAKASGFVSAPIHASVSGTVKAIKPFMTAAGQLVDSIIVENDGLYEEVAYQTPPPVDSLSKDELLNLIGDAGIVGLGGAGFPTKVKLSPPNPEEIDTFIVNCAECEPYLAVDHQRVLLNAKEIVAGLKIVLRLFPNAKGIFAFEDNKKDCAKVMEEEIKGDDRLRVLLCPTKYPQGSEKQLIKAATGREICSFTLPYQVGCIVNNAETIYAIYQAVMFGKPLISRLVTVSGDAIRKPANYLVYFGTMFADLFEESNAYVEEMEKLISGGPMMGFALPSDQIPIGKQTNGILGFQKDEVVRAKTTPCINCGACVRACPDRLCPARLIRYVDRFDKEAFQAEYGMECSECGCCSFVCPSKIPLRQGISSYKRLLLKERGK